MFMSVHVRLTEVEDGLTAVGFITPVLAVIQVVTQATGVFKANIVVTGKLLICAL